MGDNKPNGANKQLVNLGKWYFRSLYCSCSFTVPLRFYQINMFKT